MLTLDSELDDHELASIPDDVTDRQAAIDLCRLMMDLSEEHYCAGWLYGLEYELFETAFVAGHFGSFGSIESTHRVALYELSRRCDGWWCWCDVSDLTRAGVRFTRFHDWLDIYKERYA